MEHRKQDNLPPKLGKFGCPRCGSLYHDYQSAAMCCVSERDKEKLDNESEIRS